MMSRLLAAGAWLLAASAGWAQMQQIQIPMPPPPASAPAPAASAAPAASTPAAPVVRSATRVQSALEICFRTPPPYPASALRDGHEGRSVVGFRISAYNFLQDVTLARSSGHESLDQAALVHLERCRIQALQRDNPFPPEGRYQLPISWRIEP